MYLPKKKLFKIVPQTCNVNLYVHKNTQSTQLKIHYNNFVKKINLFTCYSRGVHDNLYHLYLFYRLISSWRKPYLYASTVLLLFQIPTYRIIKYILLIRDLAKSAQHSIITRSSTYDARQATTAMDLNTDASVAAISLIL